MTFYYLKYAKKMLSQFVYPILCQHCQKTRLKYFVEVHKSLISEQRTMVSSRFYYDHLVSQFDFKILISRTTFHFRYNKTDEAFANKIFIIYYFNVYSDLRYILSYHLKEIILILVKFCALDISAPLVASVT